MQEHIYTAKTKKIIGQTWLIWLFVVMQVVFTVLYLAKWGGHQIGGMLFFNAMLGLVNIPGIVLFARYYKHSVGKRFIVTYDTLKYVDEKTGQYTELINTEIEKVILVESPRDSRLPWIFHGYFVLIDSKGNKIIITSYFMGPGDFWLDTLRRRVSSDNIVREEKTYPWF